MKPSRLFLKLFLAFWGATSLSFFIAVGLMRLNDDHRDPSTERRAEESFPGAMASAIREEGAALPPPRDCGPFPGCGHAVGPPPGPGLGAPPGPGGEHRGAAPDPRRPPGAEGPPPVPITPLVIGTLVSLLFSTFLAWYLSRPLLHLGRALRSVAEGHLDTRVKPLMGRRRDEIVDLAGDFDRMVLQLQQLMDARQRLLHDISHELRSPLTRLQAAIGLLRQRPEQGASMLERIQRESERLDGLIEELLTLARLEAGSDNIARERVDLIELLGAIAEDAGFEAETKGCTLNFRAEGQFVSLVSGEMLYRAFENVVRNAVKFTDPGSAVTLEAHIEDEGRRLHIRVRDRGPGVAPQMLEAIFEPFKRAESDTPVVGFGLGLAIARRAVEMHGGSIRASLGEGGGLVVDIRLPKL
ncbi:sensory histidine protein kinase [Azotobacter vinelandii CA]|uniref:histidine kinase n=2 Tax=Azotobacter vinelandii TaxID=354 RepID=C1DNB1_AZOVD|nr:ATP-binding protein [Azotobacter vinelandii]ACO79278.1 sensory histidine protein kinase [Azotobacter vinelandii DJ]AGK16449.1 sensory histidine protein kinase [Azotobacter vinelandii CA]AGK21088.1 sensory histidine protein kinase [Azotobacter vinelandii CA6]SFY17795.1 Signal transduction histidine kinase [Azotobacter vinelandii]GLK61848.1 two-component sensor histidine kinase [Azotobacter vinelandii]